MKIAEISANYGRGGPGGVMKDIASCALKKGYDCRVYYGRGKKPDEVESERIGSDLSVYAHALKSRFFDCSGFASTGATRKLVSSLEAYRPDVVHLHNPIGYYLDVETLFRFLNRSKIPVVWTLHDCWSFTGHCISFERVNCEKWKKLCKDCPLKTDYPQSYFLDNSERNFRKKSDLFNSLPGMYLVTPSVWLSDLVKQSFLKEHRCTVIHNGIDTEVFRPTESNIRKQYGLEHKTILLAVAGVWNEMKGIGFIQQLAKKLDSSYKIVIIGDSKRFDLPDNVIRIPRTENLEQLVQWYSAADVFINPTFGDNFPSVNLEALSCGTPVVTNETGGSAEAAGDVFGRIVHSKTVEEFIIKIKECIRENYKADEIRDYALQYDRVRCSEKYFELFNRLLGENRWHY